MAMFVAQLAARLLYTRLRRRARIELNSLVFVVASTLLIGGLLNQTLPCGHRIGLPAVGPQR
jgi:hypothetical protein